MLFLGGQVHGVGDGPSFFPLLVGCVSGQLLVAPESAKYSFTSLVLIVGPYHRDLSWNFDKVFEAPDILR